MSAPTSDEPSYLPILAAILGLPALVGVVAVVDGYPLPERPASVIGVVVGGLLMAGVGAMVAWLRTHRLIVAPAAAVLGVIGGAGWAVIEPGMTSVRVGNVVILEGGPILSRFVGVTPLLMLSVAGLAVLEAAARGTTSGPPSGPSSPQFGHLAALAYGFLAGLLLAVVSVVPSVLLGDPIADPAHLVYAGLGGILGGMVLGYCRLRYRILAPLLVLAVVAGGAVVGVTAGGSPRGFPMAWPVWLGLAIVLAGIEGVARGIQGRIVGR